MKNYHKTGSIGKSAASAGIDEKTARKYKKLGKLPSQCRKEHTWRTRTDPFIEVWKEITAILERDASVEALTIFEYLNRTYPGRWQEGQLRTLQRRVKTWRAKYGEPKEAFFAQEHEPGRQAQSDYTRMNALGVTIQGQPFDHMIYHFTLTYSNWESVTICYSESFESLSTGLQNALWELGAAPREHRTDSLTAAVNNLKSKDQWTRRYQGLMDHYGMQMSHSTPGRGHENGDVEQSHHRFKRAVEQEMILRGRRDFNSREEYDAFLKQITNRRNSTRREKLAKEIDTMRELPLRRLEDHHTEHVKVSRNSTIRASKNTYSVDSRLIGEHVDARVFHDHIELWYAGQKVDRFSRLRGEGKHRINYRHIIHSLERKPGAFARYCYREALFPRVTFRIAYDGLREHYPSTADRQYIHILRMAADEGEDRVDEIIRGLIHRGETVTARIVEEYLKTESPNSALDMIRAQDVSLTGYDALLSGEEVSSWAM